MRVALPALCLFFFLGCERADELLTDEQVTKVVNSSRGRGGFSGGGEGDQPYDGGNGGYTPQPPPANQEPVIMDLATARSSYPMGRIHQPADRPKNAGNWWNLGNTYSSVKGKITTIQITHTMRHKEASLGRKMNAKEFADGLKSLNISLKSLPQGYIYVYDRDKHDLFIYATGQQG